MAVARGVFNRRRHLSDHPGPQRRRDGRGGNGQVARPLAVDLDPELRLRFLETRLDVRDTRNPTDLRDELLRHAIEHFDLGSAHADLNRLLAERSRFGKAESQSRHHLDGPAPFAQHLAEALAPAFLQLDEGGSFGDGPERRSGLADGGVGVFHVGHGAKSPDHLQRAVAGLAQRRAWRGLERHLVLAAVEVRHEVAAEDRENREGADERDHRDGHHGPAVPQRPIEGVLVPDVQIVERLVEALQHAADRSPAAILLDIRIVPAGRQHRVEREADEQRDEHGRGDGDAEFVKELADHARHERDGNEHRDDRERRRHDGEPDLGRAVTRRLEVILAALHVPHDVLAHDDRIVDQHADRQ